MNLGIHEPGRTEGPIQYQAHQKLIMNQATWHIANRHRVTLTKTQLGERRVTNIHVTLIMEMRIYFFIFLFPVMRLNSFSALTGIDLRVCPTAYILHIAQLS